LLASTLTGAGCSLLLPTGEADRERRIGEIDSEYYEARPGAPINLSADTVQAGTPLSVSIRTVGNGCYSKGPTDAGVRGLKATVTPYDFVRVADVCTEVLKSFDHEAQVTFGQPGEATVRVRVRIKRASATVPDSIVTVDTTLTRSVVVE
jgi:hypothetical protein